MDKKEIIELVQNFIKENADVEKAHYDEHYISTSYEIKGINTKDLEVFAKELVAQGVEFKNLPLTNHDEIMLAGLVISYTKQRKAEKLKDIEKYLSYVDNWATCDVIIPRLKGFEKKKDYFVKLLNSNRTYYVRFAIIWFMKNLLKKDVRGTVNLIKENVHSTNNYVEMALCNLYTDALIRDYDYMIEFIQTLERYVVRNRTLQKACESNRLSAERKKEVRALRSKLLGMEI